MKLFKIIKTFRNDDSGAVTVDWVVLTAAVVGLGLAVLSTVKSGSNDLAAKISSSLGSVAVSTN